MQYLIVMTCVLIAELLILGLAADRKHKRGAPTKAVE